MSEISNRDKNLIRTKVAEKLVDKICEGLINNAPLVDNLRESLGNQMLVVLSDPANKSKISQTILQAINTSVSLPLRGPLLLYALMDNDESYEYTQNIITFVFGEVYKDNYSINKFSGKLTETLRDPPYDSWFKNINNKVSGGKKQKTKRRTTRRKKNKTKSKRKYSRKRKIYGGGDDAATDLVSDAATSVASSAVESVSNAATSGASDAIEEEKGAGEEELDGNEVNEEEGDGNAVNGEEGDGSDEEEGDGAGEEEGDGTGEEEGEEKNETNSSTSSSNASGLSAATSMISSTPKKSMSGSQISDDADEIVSKYNNALFDLIIKDLETVKSQILQRMLNACYLHATNNSNVILTSITNSIGNIVQQSMNTGVLQYDYPNFIILVQAMRPSSLDIVNALTTTYMNQKQKARDDGKTDDVPFKPTDTDFIVDFMSNFKDSVSKKINLDLTDSN